MFQTENVKAYLKSMKLDTDNNKRFAQTRFFVALSHELATEASPYIADRLFRKNGDVFDPVQEVSTMDFVLNFPRQSLSYRRSPDYVGHDVLIPDVGIDSVTAQKLIGKKDFTLMFDCQFEINDKTIITDLIDLLKESFFLTFKPLQPGLFDKEGGPVMALACLLCKKENPEFSSADEKRAYCSGCKHNAAEDDHPLKRIRPDVEKAAAIADGMREPGDESDKPKKDPLEDDAEDGAFINTRNSHAGRKKR